MSRGRPALVVAACLVTAAPLAHDRITTRVTWSADIAPIVDRSCTGCHRPGGPAPMSLATYAVARPWARAMRTEVVAGRMPVWHAARGIGRFENDRSLRPFEAALVAAWADGGAPEGPAVRRPRTDEAAMADLYARLPRRAAAPAGETVSFDRSLTVRRDAWISAWRFHANDPAIVAAEFTLADGTPLVDWAPPDGWVRLPQRTGLRLPAPATVRARLTYRSASLQQDFPVELPRLPPVLALELHDSPPEFTVEPIDVPCGASPVGPARVVSLQPRTAAPGQALGVSLHRDDAPPVALLRVRSFDPADRTTYRLAEVVEVRAGTRLVVEGGTGDCLVRVAMAD